VYAQYKDDDGFLYVTYAGENAFGLFSSTSAAAEHAQEHPSRRGEHV